VARVTVDAVVDVPIDLGVIEVGRIAAAVACCSAGEDGIVRRVGVAGCTN
jgi:hypothetical protein